MEITESENLYLIIHRLRTVAPHVMLRAAR